MTKDTEPTELMWQDRVFEKYVDLVWQRSQSLLRAVPRLLWVLAAGFIIALSGKIPALLSWTMNTDASTLSTELSKYSVPAGAALIVLGGLYVLVFEGLWLALAAARTISRLSDEEARQAKQRYLTRAQRGLQS